MSHFFHFVAEPQKRVLLFSSQETNKFLRAPRNAVKYPVHQLRLHHLGDIYENILSCSGHSARLGVGAAATTNGYLGDEHI
ncbi:MAG: hypothetical protein IJT26_03565 [Bacteroidales bacterium]|nr:hypothetical protein [Bacteroidales bacterium]